MALRRSTVSDTITVTPDGRTQVDVRKLFAKKHIQDAIRAMRAKTVIISKPKTTAVRATEIAVSR